MSELSITYYGTRGSIPSPGKATSIFGGNTSCSLVEYKSEKTGKRYNIIIDAGTGIRALSYDLMKKAQSKKIYLIITHTHWDHIQGFPFFIPAYVPGFEIEIFGYASGSSKLSEVLSSQQNFQNFPVSLESMSAKIQIHNTIPKKWEIDGLNIKTLKQTHPGGSIGLRFNASNSSLSFCTDVEHIGDMNEKVKEFVYGSNLFAYDSQYFPEEYPEKKGYGHSTYEQAAEIANAANVKNLHLIHHDPTHSDDKMSTMENRARKLFNKTIAAREGIKIDIE